MFENMENLKITDIIKGPASRYKEFKCRQNHGLVFKISGESSYYFENEEIIHRAGEILYIPKGSKYKLKCNSQKSEYLLINFDADIKNAHAGLFSVHHYAELEYIYKNLERLWLFGGISGYYKCLSVFYDIISFISHQKNIGYPAKQNYLKIAKGIEYLENNIFNPSLKVEMLSSICNMSGTRFREIFKENLGMTPSEYITHKRLLRAHSIIESGEYEKISDVAFLSGYDDALYFSKLFKAKYKVSPSKYRSID